MLSPALGAISLPLEHEPKASFGMQHRPICGPRVGCGQHPAVPNTEVNNLMCGSGTSLAERASICPAAKLIGVDISRAALEKARKNLSGVAKGAKLLEEGVGELSLADSSVNVICADLPWGPLIGNRSELHGVYLETLRQAARVCMPGGRFAVLTQEVQAFEKALNAYKRQWEVVAEFRVKQADYTPKFYVLKRLSASI